MSWRVELGPVARTLDRLDPVVRRRVLAETVRLEQDPRHARAKKLRGRPGLWRVRAGDWRIVYLIDDAERVVTVATVEHRSKVYRR